jgi:hypothetical protein
MDYSYGAVKPSNYLDKILTGISLSLSLLLQLRLWTVGSVDMDHSLQVINLMWFKGGYVGLQEFDMNYLFLERTFMDVQVSAFSSDMDSCEKNA